MAFPFGHGLSYTQFETSRPTLTVDRAADRYRAGMTVRNMGSRPETQVVQAYVSLPASANMTGAMQPPKRLVGFDRVTVAPGETRTVTIPIDPKSSNHPLGIWDSARKTWSIPKGEYVLRVGISAAAGDLVEAGRFTR